MSKYVPLLCAVWNRPEKYEWQNEWKGKWRATYAALKWAACAFAGRSEEWPGHTSCPSYRDDVYEYAPQSTARKSKQICRRMCFRKTCVYACEVWMWAARWPDVWRRTSQPNQNARLWSTEQKHTRADLTKRHGEAARVREKEALLIYCR